MRFAAAWNEGVAVFVLCCVFIGIVVPLGAFLYRKIKAKTGNRFVAGCVVAVFAHLAYVAYPSSAEKNPDDPRERINFLQTDPEIKYLIDEGSWVSSNAVHLEFSTRLLPSSAPLFLDYIPKTEPPESNNYSTYLAGTVESVSNIVEFTFEGALSNRWVFYTTYTPGPSVHTNGVAVAEFMKATKYDNVAVPKRSTIWEDGKRIYPTDERVDLLNALGEEIDNAEMD